MAFELFGATNKTFKIMKKANITLIAVLLSIIFVSCNNTNQSDWEQERMELTDRIDNTIDDIDDELTEINNDLKDASEDVAESLEEEKEELLDQKSALEEARDNVADATEEAWEDTKDWAEETYNDVEDFLSGRNGQIKPNANKKAGANAPAFFVPCDY